jgi:hypothetical protein
MKIDLQGNAVMMLIEPAEKTPCNWHLPKNDLMPIPLPQQDKKMRCIEKSKGMRIETP